MRFAIVGFALGIWFLQRLEALPGKALLVGCVILSALLALVGILASRAENLRRGRPLGRAVCVLAALIAGFSWAGWRAETRLAEALPMQWELRDLEVTGVVHGLPREMGAARRFEFRVESSEAPVPGRLLLSWYPPRRGEGVVPEIMPGERWTLTVRLRRPHGFANPHGFDYEAWLLERGIRATGYVRTNGVNQRVDAFAPGMMNRVHDVRARVRARFLSALPDAPQAGILVALAVGDQQAISTENWEVFRRTGVAHLVSISGLHVSLVALLFGGAVAWGWRRMPAACLRWPARKAGTLAGLVAASLYALMAGFGLPTQRALMMLVVAAIALMSGREVQASRVLAIALFVVLLFDPWAVLSAGFWLSFGAVAIIVFILTGRRTVVQGWRAALRIQLAITLATVPPLLALFNAFSIVAPVANAFAIPLVSFVIAPLALAAIALPFAPILEIAHWFVGWMMLGLAWLAEQPFALWRRPALPALLIAASALAVFWLLLPRGTPGRSVALLMLAPAFLWMPPRPDAGEFRAVVLDVGQGLAVHVQTAGHDLVFDSGPPYGPDADAGGRVLLPYLGAIGVKRLHKLVISHGDSDHIGGAATLTDGIAVSRLVKTPVETHPDLASRALTVGDCVAGEGWEWDEVRFEWLNPGSDPAYRKINDHACVLRIAGAGGVFLVTSDIEAIAERSILGRDREALAADVVTAPHHGSRTSSSPAFVAAVGATHVIHPVGNMNQYRHPHPAVWARWDAAGARNWRTDGQGAIIVDMRRDGPELSAQRERVRRYWHGR